MSIEEVKKTPPPKKRPSFLLRLLTFLLTAALVLGAVSLIVYRDKLNFDAVRRFFTYRALTKSDGGEGEPFPYEGGSHAIAADLKRDLLTVSPSGIRLYSQSGTPFVEETVALEYPACDTAAGGAVVYDAGGSTLKVYQNRSEVFSLEDAGGPILSARLNDAGWLTVVTRESGFKGVVTLYDASFRPVAAYRLSSAFVLDAALSPDCTAVAVITAGQADYVFESTLARYDVRTARTDGTDELTPTATLSLGNNLSLELLWDAGGIRILTEYALTTVSGDFAAAETYDWSGKHLKLFTQHAESFSAVLLGRYRAGNAAELVTLDRGGDVLALLDVNEQVLSISCAGRYLAVLTADRLDIYTKELTPYGTLRGTQGARDVVMRDDGSALLLTGEIAWLYIP